MSTVFKLRGTGLASRWWPMDVLTRLCKLCKENPLSAHCYAVYYLNTSLIELRFDAKILNLNLFKPSE